MCCLLHEPGHGGLHRRPEKPSKNNLQKMTDKHQKTSHPIPLIFGSQQKCGNPIWSNFDFSRDFSWDQWLEKNENQFGKHQFQLEKSNDPKFWCFQLDPKFWFNFPSARLLTPGLGPFHRPRTNCSCCTSDQPANHQETVDLYECRLLTCHWLIIFIIYDIYI